VTIAGLLTIDRHLPPDARRSTLEADVRAGFASTPKALPPKWFYDARGSALFDEITRLPEYYLTRCERFLLEKHAAQIAEMTGADTLMELGSGTSEKTRLLLTALRAGGRLERFIPFDVDEAVLTESAAAVAAEYPGVSVHAVVGDFEHHLGLLPRGGRRLIAFLGSTIGNLVPAKRREFLDALASGMEAGDSLLLGTDLVKDEARLVRAYNDSAGVTAEFNRNVLRVLSRELGSDVDPTVFEHIASWNADQSWIEMRLRATRDVVVHVLDLEVPFVTGEDILTEISAKFRREQVTVELEAAGLTLAAWWTDPAGDFALSLAVRS
jgi:L-histidine N-alpha-methyltransferase